MPIEKKRIQEVIVVEGHHDTEHLRRFYDCDTIETSGTHLGKDILDRIEEANKTRGVIIFTDPDSPGNRIRNTINEKIPNCKNAFVVKKDAKTEHKVGVEHANKLALDEALNNLVTYVETSNTLTMNDFLELGLTGNKDSKQKRDTLGEYFHIGGGNAKTMLRRINFLNVSKEEIKKVINNE